MRQVSLNITRKWLRRWSLAFLGVIVTLAITLCFGSPVPASSPVSNYELSQAADFNRLEHYPIQPLPSSENYRPAGNWVGRLILPTVEEYSQEPGDWVWIELWHAPGGLSNLIGEKVKLTWKDLPYIQKYLDEVTNSIQFTERATKYGDSGNIVPTRLDGRQSVGPLQSLAGARPKDDMTVKLVGEPGLIENGGIPVISVGFEPVQITGREYGLVKLLEPDSSVNKPLPEVCPGGPPCPTEYFKVQHFSPDTGDFSGDIETIRIPQQPLLKGDRFFSNIRDLIDSPSGSNGWYIYGARDGENIFTVRSLKPRALVQLETDEVILGNKPGRNYIDRQNWRSTPARKGSLQRVLVSPDATTSEAATDEWQEGDQVLVIHLFGGIGGENKELTPAGTVTGHFAFGIARVIREPIADELQFDIHYQQIYTHNSGGIISGTHDWTSYAGDMQRGWIGQRPFSDVVVKLDYFTKPITLGDTNLSLFQQLLIQAQVIAARYRTGDGDGLSTITPATSCVQDSNQALYIAIQQVRFQTENNPELVEWIDNHPDDPEVQKVRQLNALAVSLEESLVPYGVVRRDWKNNAEQLAGVNARGNGFVSSSGVLAGILSWRDMMPRWGQDDLALTFLNNGGDLWFLRPNQIGGFDATIEPIPPTTLFGLIPGLSRVTLRLARSFAITTSAKIFILSLIALALITVVTVPFGFNNGFLRKQLTLGNPFKTALNFIRLFFIPAMTEEIIFRVMLIPHWTEGVPIARWFAWAILSLGLFVLYHVILSRGRLKAGSALSDRRFLLIVLWIGIVLTGLYGLTGSLWAITLVHWIIVVCWIYGFGGLKRLQGKSIQSLTPSSSSSNTH